MALTTFSDLVGEAREQVRRDAVAAGLADDGRGLAEGGAGSWSYADAVATYLSAAVDKLSDWSSTICSWIHSIQGVRDTFARQAIPMVWDYAEINPLSDSVGNFGNHVEWVVDSLSGVPADGIPGEAHQQDASAARFTQVNALVSCDPPYYDNIGYADLSDFFYVWLRRSLAKVYPDLFLTLLTPKVSELVATPYRFDGDKSKAERFFEDGLGNAFVRMREAQHPDYPMTVFYAFKQAELSANGDETAETGAPSVAATGWETMLEGLLGAGCAITGTWPMRTERSARSIGIGTNALSS